MVKFAYYLSISICYKKICKFCEFVLTYTIGFHVSTIISSSPIGAFELAIIEDCNCYNFYVAQDMVRNRNATLKVLTELIENPI